MAKIYFVLGGIRSGKSKYAEERICAERQNKLYIATAAILDEEMQERVGIHKKRRNADWKTIEEQVKIAEIITKPDICGSLPDIILVDCLTVWLANLFHYKIDISQKTDEFLYALTNTKTDVVLVSNEVGQGIIPDNEMARKFCDEAGILHQKVASIVDEVVLVTAGIPIKIKG